MHSNSTEAAPSPRRVKVPPLPASTLAPAPGRWLWTCRAGFEGHLYEELAWQEAEPRLLGAGLVESDSVRNPPAFARVGFPVRQVVGSIAKISLPKEAFNLQVWAPDTEPGNRLSVLAQTVESALALPAHALPEAASALTRGALLCQVCLIPGGQTIDLGRSGGSRGRAAHSAASGDFRDRAAESGASRGARRQPPSASGMLGSTSPGTNGPTPLGVNGPTPPGTNGPTPPGMNGPTGPGMNGPTGPANGPTPTAGTAAANETFFAIGELPARDALSLSPGGRHRMRRERAAPSRAAMKLEEAFDWLGVDPGRGEDCVDLGAAPGGWTQRLVERGAKVIAVDPANLTPELERHPKVEHIKASAFAWTPEEPVEWLFCDMAWRPLEVAQLLGKWARRRLASVLVANFKLPMNDKNPMLWRIRHVLTEGGWVQVKMRQLYHDRDEVTVTAHLRK
jgi:hypothetical protein